MAIKSILMSDWLFISMYKRLFGMLLVMSLVGCSSMVYNNTAPGQVVFNSKSINF